VAEYDLAKVKAAAQQLNIEYRGRKVNRDVANLGYDLNDVANCLCQLTPNEFRKTHTYRNQLPDDEYICSYKKDSETPLDKLYIKFCIVDDCLVIDLASFHLSQF
jgi:hypothetical protein